MNLNSQVIQKEIRMKEKVKGVGTEEKLYFFVRLVCSVRNSAGIMKWRKSVYLRQEGESRNQ
jgi:hypothetical protein